MFTLAKDDKHLSFSIERENSTFGEGNRVLFWIDCEMRMLQRGRQEYIPLDSIESFSVDCEEYSLVARFGADTMVLYEGDSSEIDKLAQAAEELNNYCK